MKEKDLASSLREQEKSFFWSRGVGVNEGRLIGGVLVDFPYSEVAHASWNERVSDNAYRNYQAMSALFNPEKIPARWVDFIKEVGKERKKNGCEHPLNLVSGLFFLTEESSYARKVGLERIGRFKNGEPNLSNGEKISETISTILNDSKLKGEYKKILSNVIPDRSGFNLDRDCIRQVLKKSGIKNGMVLDLGCGTGENTTSCGENMFTIGIERQYYDTWYGPNWKSKENRCNNRAFARGDFNQGLPIKDKGVDIVMFQFVAHHITQKSMENGLKESLRVLKADGWLFVGPQESDRDDTWWRYFRKETLGDEKVSRFVEYGYYDIVPEDKPNWWK